MAQTGYTPIQLYNSATASAAPTAGNLATGELALNITDGKLFYKDNSNVVQVLATKGAGTIGGSDTQVQYNSSGALAGSANLTFNGTLLTAAEATVTGATTLSATTQNLALGTSQTSGTWTAGGAAQTGALTLDQSTKTHTLALGTGATESGATKTVNIATGGVSGSTTTMTIGSTNGTSVTANGAWSYASNPVLSGGTANGVTYLNGSKVLTSGSALTFDGAKALTVGTGTATQRASVTLDGGANAGVGAVYGISIGGSLIGGMSNSGYAAADTSTDLAIFGDTGKSVRFYANASEQMRLTSTGLGIGTSSPATKLEVSGSAAVARVSGTAGTVPQLQLSSSGVVNWSLRSNNDSGSDFTIYQDSTQRLKIDTSGNLGIGTSSPSYKLDVQAATSVIQTKSTTGTNAAYYVANNTGGDFYIGRENSAGTTFGTTAYSSVLWAAGAYPMSFFTNGTERMRLDSSGNLGLGVTPSAWDTAVFRTLQVGTGAGSASLSGRTDGANNAVFGVNLYYGSGAYRYIATSTASYYNQQNGAHSWFTAPSGTAGNTISFTQAMTLTADINLGLNIADPQSILNNFSSSARGIAVSNAYPTIVLSNTANATYNFFLSTDVGEAYVWNRANGPMLFATNNTERARITSGGDFGIGNTNPQYRLTVDKDTTSALAFFTNSNASAPYGAYIDFSAASPNNATQYFLYCEDSTAQRATIFSNGGLANYQGNDTNLSDRREKTNFAPAKDYLDTICAIPVQTFNYIDQSEDDPGLTLGVVAQDVQAVAPELVMESNWGTEDNPKMRLSIYQTDLQYALMKCVQELKAELDSVKAELATLKGQP